MNNNRQSWRLWVYLLAASVTVFLATSLAASAQTVNDYGLKSTASAAGLPTGNVTPAQVASTIITILLSVIGVLMVVLILYSGFLWMTAAGNEEKVGRAKKILSGAIIGAFIVMTAYAIASFVIGNLVKLSASPTPQTPNVIQCTPAGTGKTTASCEDTCLGPVFVEVSNTNCASPKVCCVTQN